MQICDSLWLNPSFFKEMEKKIADAPMKPKTYRYSDVGFILLRLLVEKLAGMPMDAYLQREFYEPMGLERTGYLPLRRFPKSEVVPSSVDRFLRKTTLQGFVHDEILPLSREAFREMPDCSRMHVKWHRFIRCC